MEEAHAVEIAPVFPGDLAEAEDETDHGAHGDQVERPPQPGRIGEKTETARRVRWCLQNAERKGDDGRPGRDLRGIVAHRQLDLAPLPGDLPDRPPQVKALPEVARQPFRDAVVPLGHPAAPRGGLARPLAIPRGDREDAQLRGVGGVEPGDELPGGGAGTGVGAATGAPRHEIVEGLVVAVGIDPGEDMIDPLPEAIIGTELTAFGEPVIARDVDVHEPRLAEDPLGQGSLAMDELGAQLDGDPDPRVPQSVDAPADAVPRLEDFHPEPPPPELSRRRQPRGPGADHRDIDLGHSPSSLAPLHGHGRAMTLF